MVPPPSPHPCPPSRQFVVSFQLAAGGRGTAGRKRKAAQADAPPQQRQQGSDVATERLRVEALVRSVHGPGCPMPFVELVEFGLAGGPADQEMETLTSCDRPPFVASATLDNPGSSGRQGSVKPEGDDGPQRHLGAWVRIRLNRFADEDKREARTGRCALRHGQMAREFHGKSDTDTLHTFSLWSAASGHAEHPPRGIRSWGSIGDRSLGHQKCPVTARSRPPSRSRRNMQRMTQRSLLGSSRPTRCLCSACPQGLAIS